MEESTKTKDKVIPTDIIDLINDLRHCFEARKEILLLIDNSHVYNLLMSLIEDEEESEWVEDTSGTAICPYCGIDSIIG